MAHRTPSLQDTALRTWVSFLVVIGGLGLLYFFNSIKSILLQLVIALILSIALYPLVRWLTKHRFNQVWASITTVIISIVVLLIVVGAIASPLITQGNDLVKNAPKIVQQIASNSLVTRLDSQFGLASKVQSLANQAPAYLSSHQAPLLGALSSIFSAVSNTIVIFIIVLFMLMEGPTAWNQFTRLLGKNSGKLTESIASKIVTAVGGFVNGNLLISVIAGIVSLVTLLIAGVPYAFALAALVAVFDLIPLVGASLATILVGLVALTQGWVTAIIVVGVLLVYQFVEGNLIQPVVYGRAVELSQLLILVASLVGATLGGIIGVLLAIPVAASVQIVIVELLRAGGADVDPKVSSSVKE